MNAETITIATIAGLAASILGAYALHLLREYSNQRFQAYRNWVLARSRRECWFKTAAEGERVYAVTEAVGGRYLELAKTPMGQRLVRIEAGAYELWVSKKLRPTRRDKAYRAWYGSLIFPEIRTEESVNT